MSTGDKVGNAAKKIKGKVKEAAGKAADDPDLVTKGQADQIAGDVGQAGEKVKDTFKH